MGKEEKKAKLEQELGRLTYEIAILREELNQKVQRSNEIGTELRRLNTRANE